MRSEIIMLADQDGRNRIKKDIETNLIVEAGAGSGKTTEMSNRIVALLESEYRNIGEIAAITFTNKAANELQQRVYARLESVYAETGSEIIREAIENYHQCFIGTIHSFCSKLLRERPIEAGVDPEFEEIDEAEDLAIRDKIWEDYVFLADDEGKDLLDVLTVLNIKASALKNFLKIVCDNQDVEFNFDYDDSVDLSYIERETNQAFQALVDFMKMAMYDMPEGISLSSDGLDGMQKSILMFQKKTKNRDDLSLEEKIKLLGRYTTSSSAKVIQKCWSSDKELKQRAKEIGIEMGELRSFVILPLFEKIKSYAYNKVFIPFVERTKLYYTGYKKQTGKMNFQDLLILTNEMLINSIDARLHFQDKYKTLLVDEFQDTDPIQAQILMYLTGNEVNEKKWDRLTPKTGSLFVVGDPKQSIYAFRRADIEIYEKFKQLVIETGGGLVELTTNFRASTDLGAWYNETFSRIFNQEEPDENIKRIQARFSDLHAIISPLENTLSGVYSKELAVKKKADVQEQEYRTIKEMMESLVGKKEITTSKISNEKDGIKLHYNARKIQYSDFMILTMKKSHLTQLAYDLSGDGIPVKAVGADVVEKAPTFAILINVVRMLARQEENAYLYRVMMSKPFNYSDDELARFRHLGGWINYNCNIEELIKGHEDNESDRVLLESVNECFDVLKRLSRFSKELPPAALIEKIAEELNLQKEMIKKSNCVAEVGSYTSLLEQLRLMPLQRLWGLDVFMSELSSLVANGLEEEIDIQGSDYDAVRIMNVHKSKGLEAPIIILAGAYSGGFPNPSLYIERTASDDHEGLFKGHISLNSDPERPFNRDRIISNHWHVMEEVATMKHGKEFDRLIYVAATRARNALIVMNSENTSDPWDKLGLSIENRIDEVIDAVSANETLLNEPAVNEDKPHVSFDMDERTVLIHIDNRRNTAFNENESTYKVIIPSHLEKLDYTLTKEFEEVDVNSFESIFIDLAHSEMMEEALSSTDFGTHIHRLFESIIEEGEAKEDFLMQLLTCYQDSNRMREVFELTSAKFITSELFSRIGKAEEVYCEVPFAYKKSGGATTVDHYINGTIDLVFKENDRWRIVDYKTCNRNHDKDELYKNYHGQLEIYKEAWKTCVEVEDVSVELFFVEK